jgi:hypothetical protein
MGIYAPPSAPSTQTTPGYTRVEDAANNNNVQAVTAAGLAGIYLADVNNNRATIVGGAVTTGLASIFDIQDDTTGETINAAGTTTKADIAIGGLSEAVALINVSAISGTSPTIQFFLDAKDINGNYRAVAQTAAISAAGLALLSLSAFSGAVAVNTANTIMPPGAGTFRLRIVTGGAVFTSGTFTYQIFGR